MSLGPLAEGGTGDHHPARPLWLPSDWRWPGPSDADIREHLLARDGFPIRIPDSELQRRIAEGRDELDAASQALSAAERAEGVSYRTAVDVSDTISEAYRRVALAAANIWNAESGELNARRAARFKMSSIWDVDSYPNLGSAELDAMSLKSMKNKHPERVLVRVWCAVHKQLVALVLHTPSDKLMLVAHLEDLEPKMRAYRSEHRDWLRGIMSRSFVARLGRESPLESTSLGEEPQPEIWCRRCRGPRPIGDLLGAAKDALASATRRDIHA